MAEFMGVLLMQPGLKPLAGYELIQRLGAGSFGEVWKARGPGGVPVALKFIRLGDHSSSVELRSLEVMKEIRHPNLIGIFGAWQQEDLLIVGMELGDRTLQQRLKEVLHAGGRGIPREELYDQMRDAARGIDHLNSLGIQHRDIKPQNLLLVGGGVKVADFGLAKVLEDTIVVNTGAMTPAYAAPEVFRGKVGIYSDQYSLAVSYCQLRGGRLPFQGNQAQLMAGHVLGEPDLSMLPAEERPAVARALAKDPDKRWPTCRAFVVALTGRSSPTDLDLPPGGGPAPGAPLAYSATAPTPVHARRPYVLIALLTILIVPILFLLFRDPLTRILTSAQPPSGPASTFAGLHLQPLADVTLDPGQSLKLPVQIERDNCPGEVDIRLENVPEGIWSEPAVLGPDDTRVELSLGARLEIGPAGVCEVKVVARSGNQRDEQRIKVTLRQTLPREIVNSVGMKLVLIQPGKFRMGSPREEDQRLEEEFEHDVHISYPFYIGATEVTQEQYVKVTGKNPSLFSEGKGGGPTHPVDRVTWLEARTYCRELSERERHKGWGAPYRLPREAEWEFACRAGARESCPFSCGLTLSSTQANYDGNHPYGGKGDRGVYREKTTPVASFKPNAWGLFDMHGNVWEWCEDWYDRDYYRVSPLSDPEGPDRAPAGSDRRVLRGGSWFNGAASCRSAQRGSEVLSDGNEKIGFRLVLIPWVRTAP